MKDPEQVSRIVEACFPELQPRRVAFLGEGWDSTAFQVNDQWVFRFPKRSEVEAQLLVEVEVMPRLAQEAPLMVPDFRFLGRPTQLFPRHFGGYEIIPGKSAIGLDPSSSAVKQWVPDLARFLSWLHGFSPHEAARLGVQSLDVNRLVEEFKKGVFEEFEALRRFDDKPLDAWYHYLKTGPKIKPTSTPKPTSSAATVLVHGDLAAEHILYDPHSMVMTGVIDWSEMALCDPSVDFAALFHWGGRPLVDQILPTYDGPVDDTVLARAEYFAACRGVADVAYGLEVNRPEYVQAGLRALELCASNH